MKKLLISLVVCLTILSASSVAIKTSAQSMSLADMVNLFIALGIIPADKADAARAAIGVPSVPVVPPVQPPMYVGGNISGDWSCKSTVDKTGAVTTRTVNFIQGIDSSRYSGKSSDGYTISGAIDAYDNVMGYNLKDTWTKGNYQSTGFGIMFDKYTHYTASWKDKNGLTGKDVCDRKVVVTPIITPTPIVSLIQPAVSSVNSGTVELGKIIISADSRGSIRINSIPLSIVGVSNGSYGIPYFRVNSSNIVTAIADGVLTFSGGGYDIAAGTSVTFSIFSDVNLPNGGSVTTKLGLASLFKWTDMNSNTSFDGSSLKNYPTNSVIVSNGDPVVVPPAATSTQPYVSLNVGGYDSTGYQSPIVNLGSVATSTPIEIRWNSTGANQDETPCNTYGLNTLKLTDGTLWDSNNLPASGFRYFYPFGQKNLLGQNVNSVSVGIQCWNKEGGSQSTGIIVSWNSDSEISKPSATVFGIPTMTIAYDSAQKESALNASFDVSVLAGSKDLYVYKNANPVMFENRTDSSKNFYGSATLTSTQTLKSTTDQFGQTYYVVPAGTKSLFNAQSQVNPKIMFAGNYVAKFNSIIAFYGDVYNAFSINTPGSTNDKTIIGETSPYINSISSSQTSAGTLVTISGVRLQKSTMADMSLWNKDYSYTNWKNSSDGKTITYLNRQLPAGYYPIQLIDSVTGKSNVVSFEVKGDTQAQYVIASPSNGSILNIGSRYLVKWTMKSTQDPHIPRVIVILSKADGTKKINVSEQQGGMFPYIGTIDGFPIQIPSSLDDGEYKLTVSSVDETVGTLDDNLVMGSYVFVKVVKSNNPTQSFVKITDSKIKLD